VPETTEEVEYTTNDEGVAYTSESAGTTAVTDKPSVIAPGGATGRRKEAIARVRLVPGTGAWTVNGKPCPTSCTSRSPRRAWLPSAWSTSTTSSPGSPAVA